jgi:hypothetical protein
LKEAGEILGQKKAITPLWIVALFVSLAEVTTGAAVTQTTGGIQIALTVFVITFPIIIASAFFITLWRKNYVLYSPKEFGQQINVKEYVEAMQREPMLANHFSLNQDLQRSTEQVSGATDKTVETLIEQIDLNGLLCLYVFSLVHKTMLPLNIEDLTSSIGFDYAWGILTTTTAIGLIDYTSSKGIVNIIYIDENLKNSLRAQIDKRINEANESDFKRTGITKEEYLNSIKNKITDIEQYYG